MSKDNPLITVGKLTFTVGEVEAVLAHAIDMAEHCPSHYNPGAALNENARLINCIKKRQEPTGM